MPAFRELSPRQRRIEIGWWIALAPVAALAVLAAQIAIGLAVRPISDASGLTTFSTIGIWVRTIPGYILPSLAWVVVGGWLAPRRPHTVAGWLMLVGGGLSLLKHIVLQQLAGNRVGPTNSIHFALETAGLLAGMACVYWLRPLPRQGTMATGGSQ